MRSDVNAPINTDFIYETVFVRDGKTGLKTPPIGSTHSLDFMSIYL